jgi:CO/xanthine dehydrogenase FAD-binding subunit
MPIREMFLGPGKSALVQNELLVGFYLPLKDKNQDSAFKRIMRPQGVALPIINMAVWLMREADRIADIHIAVGPGGPKPWRALESETSLRGKILNDESLKAALEILLRDVKFRTSQQRASAEYRRELARPLFIDTVKAAWEQAQL